MNVTYSQDGKTAYFDGEKFRKDQKTGYFLAAHPTYQGKRERLHVYVWRKYNGPVPDGFHIHHVDGNKDNNEPENLACVPVSEHTAYHSRKYVKERIMKKGNAKSVEMNLKQTNTQSRERAPENAGLFFVPVVSVKSVGFEPVYNLEVEEFHNFAVNGGIIVHNCMDAMRYFVNSLPDWRFEVVQTK